MLLLVLTILIPGLLSVELCGRQNVNVPSSYSRQLWGSAHTWAFEGKVTGVRYKDGTPVTVEEVRKYIQSAIQQWCRAANQEGERVHCEEAKDYFSADIKVLFFPYNGSLGQSGAGYVWVADSGHAWPARLETTILHEMGHVFIGSGHHGDGVLSYNIGSGHPSLVCTSLGQDEQKWTLELYNPRINFRVGNVFGNESRGGRILIDGTESIIPSDPGFVQIDSNRASSFPHTVVAVGRQSAGGFLQEFDSWNGDNSRRSLTIEIDTFQNARYYAQFRNIYNLRLENDFAGRGNGGFIRIDNMLRSLPNAAFEVVHGNDVSVEAPDQVYELLRYAFLRWSDGGKANPYVLRAVSHVNIKAHYIVTGALPPPGVGALNNVGASACVVWSQHSSADVTMYRVWRRLKQKTGSLSVAECVATLDRSATSWTDSRYLITPGFTDDLVSYGVQSFHAPTSTYSEIEFTQVFAKRTSDDLTVAPGQSPDATPSDYSVSHYPDPVRSSAKIVCGLHLEALVSLEVYDVTGKKMITLVEDRWPAGYHTVVWNGRDERGMPVSAGVYFYRLRARPVSGGQPGVITVSKKTIKL